MYTCVYVTQQRNDPKNSEDIFKAIDKNAIQNFVIKLMDNAMKFEIVFKPKE